MTDDTIETRLDDFAGPARRVDVRQLEHRLEHRIHSNERNVEQLIDRLTETVESISRVTETIEDLEDAVDPGTRDESEEPPGEDVPAIEWGMLDREPIDSHYQ